MIRGAEDPADNPPCPQVLARAAAVVYQRPPKEPFVNGRPASTLTWTKVGLIHCQPQSDWPRPKTSGQALTWRWWCLGPNAMLYEARHLAAELEAELPLLGLA